MEVLCVKKWRHISLIEQEPTDVPCEIKLHAIPVGTAEKNPARRLYKADVFLTLFI
jgi:hypothetical protein